MSFRSRALKRSMLREGEEYNREYNIVAIGTVRQAIKNPSYE